MALQQSAYRMRLTATAGTADVSVFMDGAFQPLIPVTEAVVFLGDADVALFDHPGGNKSYHDERNFYQRLHGYVPDDVEATYQRYVADGVPVTGTSTRAAW